MHRRTHNRHAPPNAMLNHFWQKIPSFQGETKPKPITPHDPNVFHPAAICRGPIVDSVDLGLVEEFTTVSSFARKPVKITMTGPHLLAVVAYDEYYNDVKAMMSDFGKLLHQNFKKLAAAGCRHIQIDEPYFTPSAEHEVAAAVDVINQSIADIPDDVHVSVHICQGNYAVGPDYDGQIGHRYFDTGRYKADLVCRIDCDAYLIEHDMTPHYEKCLGGKQLGVGAVDVQAPNVETAEQIAERIRAHSWLQPEQTIITSSCGFNHLPRHVAFAKMRAMTEAQLLLRGR
jgi:5-methyltetrahydropteroyltriglutamate--homocysteine methyltransferase